MKYIIGILMMMFLCGCSKEEHIESSIRRQLLICKDGYQTYAYSTHGGQQIFVPKFVMKNGQLSLIECFN